MKIYLIEICNTFYFIYTSHNNSYKPIRQAFATLAYPANTLGRRHHHQGIGQYITSYNRTNKGKLANGLPYITVALAPMAAPRFTSVLRYSFVYLHDCGIINIGRHHTRAAKHIIVQRYPVIDGSVIQHPDVVANNQVIPHKTFWPNEQRPPIWAAAVLKSRMSCSLHPHCRRCRRHWF